MSKQSIMKRYFNGYLINIIIILVLVFLEIFLYTNVSDCIKYYSYIINNSSVEMNLNYSKMILDGFCFIFLLINTLVLLIHIFTIIGSIIGAIKGLIVGEYQVSKEELKIKLDNPYLYFRELPNNYGIGIATMLIDSDIEYKKDVVAAVLDLCAKKYLKLEKIGDTYRVKLLDKDESSLLSNEKYIMNYIKNNNIKEINYDEWYKLCASDGIQLGLYELRNAKDKFKKKKIGYSFKIHFLISILFSLVVMSMIIPTMQESNIVSITGAFLLILFISFFALYFPYIIFTTIIYFYSLGKNQQNVIYKHILNSSLLKTQKGVEELHKLYAFKKFIKDFGSFASKNIEEVMLWDYYLSYAQVFGLTNTILKSGYKQLVNNTSFLIDNIDNIKLENIILEGH